MTAKKKNFKTLQTLALISISVSARYYAKHLWPIFLNGNIMIMDLQRIKFNPLSFSMLIMKHKWANFVLIICFIDQKRERALVIVGTLCKVINYSVV